MVVDLDGDYWMFYQDSGASHLSGVVAGNGTTNETDTTFIDTDGKDYQEELLNQPIKASTLDTTYLGLASLSGTLTEDSSVVSTFSLTYADINVSLPLLTGATSNTYEGILVASGNDTAASATFSADGSFSGTVTTLTPSGNRVCHFTGTASQGDNGHHFVVTFHADDDATNCGAVSNQSGSGIAYLNTGTGRLFAFVSNNTSPSPLHLLFDLTLTP